MTQADSYLRAPVIVAGERERIRRSAGFVQLRHALERRVALRFGACLARAGCVGRIRIRLRMRRAIRRRLDRVAPRAAWYCQAPAAAAVRTAPSDAVTIRRAELADIPAMHQVRMAVRENRLTDPSRVQPRDYEPRLAEHGRGLVAERDGRIVGFAVGDLTRQSVWALFVHPDHERRGIGRRLHDELLQWMFAAGIRTIWLTTEPGTRAASFYVTAGWRLAGTTPQGELRFERSGAARADGPAGAKTEWSNAAEA